MKLNSITSKLLILISAAFITTTICVLFLADKQLTSIIDESQEAVYAEKVEAICEILNRNHKRLQKTGLVEAYIDDFKDASLKIIRQTYYKQPDQPIYPFIVTTDGSVVMHPELTDKKSFLEQTEVIEDLLDSEKNQFEYTYLGQKKWVYHKHFPEWNWVVAYVVPLEIKYYDVRRFIKLLVLIIVGITVLVLLVLSVIIARFTTPISRLTLVSKAISKGNLDQQIDPGGSDEVGILANSFIAMRDSIRRSIEALEKENTERKSAEERLSVTLRSIGDGVITTDVSGKVVLLNKVAEDLTGWSIDEARNRPLEEIFNIINEYTRDKQDNPASEVIRKGQIIGLPKNTVLLTKDGRELNVADSVAPILDEQSKIIGTVLVFRDVTEQIKTEKELLKIKKLESVGVLAGGIAHDFNNILAAILGNIDLALYDKNLGDKTKKLLSEAEKASIRAKGLTQQLLTFAKGGEPVKETSSLERVIRDSANFVMHGHKSVCTYDIPKDLWLVDIDKGQMSQVIQNMVLNASHAMSEGGVVKLTCENLVCGDEELLPFAKKERVVKISIEDSGIGMYADVVERIFDPYFSTKQEGSGLGLAIAQSILQKHGGHIMVESSPGVGSTFTIYLPASKRTAKQEQELSEESKATLHGKILLMDDEEAVRNVAKEMLEKLGYEVVLAADGKEAINLYKDSLASGSRVDLLIMDLTIQGGMGGKEAAQEVLNIDPEAKIIVSSGYSNDPVVSGYKEYGFCSMIVKPYRLKELSMTISQLMG
jgi:PAS domain S-box-containing protein